MMAPARPVEYETVHTSANYCHFIPVTISGGQACDDRTEARWAEHLCPVHGARKAQLVKSVAFEDLGAGVDPPCIRDDQLAILSLQEGSSDMTRPDDEVPQAIELLDDDVH